MENAHWFNPESDTGQKEDENSSGISQSFITERKEKERALQKKIYEKQRKNYRMNTQRIKVD